MCSIQLKTVLFICLIFKIFATCDNECNLGLFRTQNNDKVLKSKEDALIFAHVIHRHGDRNILFSYKNDPWKDESNWVGGFEELTREGKRQTFELGQYLRRRYGKIIGDQYSPNKVYVRSTDVDRTLMSAQANLAGLFPPTANETWNEYIPWQPIPVHTMPILLDHVLSHDSKCPKYDEALQKFLKESTEIQQIYTKYADKFEYWSRMTGENITTIFDAYELYGIFYIETMQNKTLPDWAKKEYNDPNGLLYNIGKLKLMISTYTKELARLRIGFLIKEMFEHFTQKINNTMKPDRSLWIYSAHDLTIVNVLNALGVFDPVHIPPYASSLHLELYRNSANEHYIQIFYRKDNDEVISAMNLPKCGKKCSLEQLYKLYSEIIPGDYDSECL
ncbi:prostatic acid phosphatase-like [Contarinia nasturtii]|uniref:prostatic acid phosphatase-like n=1 Tax=Contarinia nasturtii TaxID=265458 RepID=UPI0012D494B2|nr:prostatic acid phosphatase-like [Contarinia nasturtii]